jgi:peptidyl-prolyl cis-trans isomerase C
MRNFSIVFMALIFLSGCDKLPFGNTKEAPVEVKASVKNENQAKPPAEEVNISGPLLARINGWQLGLDDFNQYIDSLKPYAAQKGIELNRDNKLKSLNEMVQLQILAQMASESNYDKLPDTLRLIREGKTSVLASKMISEIDKNITVTSADIQKFYNENKDKYYSDPEERKVRELAVNSEAEMKDVNIKLLNDEDFGALAQKVSVLDTAAKGGDLGFIPMDPRRIQEMGLKKFEKFWQAVVTTEKGQVSSKFKGDDGKLYLIKIEDIKPPVTKPLSGEVVNDDGTKVKIEDQIKAVLRIQKTQAEIDRRVKDFKSRAKVEVKEDLVK